MTTQLLPIIYQLDVTGENVNNKIVEEPHILETKRVRSIAPLHAPFYSDSIVIKDTASNRILDRTEYKFFNLLGLASAMYGKEIYSIVLITNPQVSNSVKITYQTLGGEYTRIYETTNTLIGTLYNDNRPVGWPNIVDKPETFNPVHHLHAVGDVIGFEYVVTALERLRNTILVASSMRADNVLEYLETRLKELSTTNTSLMSTINAISTKANEFASHITNKQNPHQVDKNQVGLSKIENYGLSTKADIISPESTAPKYVTNIVLKEYLNEAMTSFNSQMSTAFSTLQTEVNQIGNKVNQSEQATQSLITTQQTAVLLNTNYTNLQTQLNQANANLSDSQTRAAAAIQQYLGSGN